jgi:hypothetical protein
MSKTLQFRRGSTTLINTLAGSDGELFVDTSKATVVVMNGVVLGGSPLATETFVTSALSRVATSATLGTIKIDTTSIVISSGTISVPVGTTAVTGLLRPDGTSVVVSSGVISVTRTFTTSFAVSGTVVMSSPFMFRNRLINGNFQFWQRGTTTATTASYLADRWIAQNISTQLQSTDVPNAAFPFSLEFGNTTSTYPYVAQRLEPIEAANLVSSELTISFWAKNTSGNATLYVELAYPQTTSVYTSTMINAGLSSFTLANPPTVSSWGYYTYTWSSSLLTTAFAQGLEVRIVRDNSNPSTTRVTGIQLESGGAATPFERLPVQQQLALCQRYYYQGGNGSPGIFNGVTTARYSVMLPVTMRTVPVTTAIAAPIIINPTIAEQQTGSQSTGFSITGLGASVSYSVAQIQFGGFTSGADGRATTLLNTALAFSAEL